MGPVRVVDFSTNESVEVPVQFFRDRVFRYIETLKITRDERLDAAKQMVSDLDEAIALFGGYVSKMEPTSKTVLFYDAMDHIANLSERIAKLYSFASSASMLMDNTVVRVSMSQFKELGL